MKIILDIPGADSATHEAVRTALEKKSGLKIESASDTKLPAIGARVKMVSENSNWNIGELGTVAGKYGDRVSVVLDGRGDVTDEHDGYGAESSDFIPA